MVQEWLNWQPWKGCGVVRRPRVRIPPIPPMCDKCLKRAIGREIIEAEHKLNNVFKKLDNDPSLAYDREFISLAECIAHLLKKYNTIKG